MRALAIVIIVACLSACHTTAPIATRESPYGLWSTERGQTVEVRRDGTFLFCDGQQCESGRHQANGRASVLLVGFANMPVTQRLRELSDWEPPFLVSGVDRDPAWSSSFELGDGGMADEFRHRLCQDRPCRIIGRASYNQYRFVKLRDY